VDAAAGLRIVQALELRLSARNLLNARYMASQDVRTVLAPGRAASVTAVLRLGRQPSP
jgi:outer membrane receptor protein involved in Fe transport